MSYTKKQLTAFREILSFCPEDKYAIHTTSNGDAERYIVTDGSACVVLVEKPEGFPMKDDGKFFYDFCEREQADGDHQLVENPVTVEDCKAAIRQWKEQLKNVPYGTPDQPRIRIARDGVEGWYDARKVLNVMTAIGPRPLLYIGYRVRGEHRIPYPTLIVKKDISGEEVGVVMPVRTR